MSYDLAEAMKRLSDEGPWDDADVERFIDRLGQFGVNVSLVDGSDTDDPRDAVDIGPEAAIDDLPSDLLFGFWAHRRDFACYLRGLRGEGRAAAVADARSEASRQMMPLMRMLAKHGVNAMVQGVPVDEVPDEDRREMERGRAN